VSALATPRRGLTQAIGACGLVLLVVTVWLALWVTPPDAKLGNQVRLLYVHPAVAWVALYCAFGLAALCSVLYLWARTRSEKYDLLAAASMEVGVVFLTLTLATGMLWGKATWGIWWTWDPRLTSTALLEVLAIGYLAMRRVPADPHVRARRGAVLSLLCFFDVALDHYSVQWWRGIHQQDSVLVKGLHFTVHGSMLFTLLLSFVAMTLVFAWMVLRRYEIALQQEARASVALDAAVLERRAEAVR
jgi:heme exporter protein C